VAAIAVYLLGNYRDCVDTEVFPGLRKAADLAMEVIQEAGDTLFVPR